MKGRRNRRSRIDISSRFLWLLLLPALAFAIGGCGGGGGGGGFQTNSGFGVDGAGGKKGGTITILSAGDVDYIDPGLAYYQFTYEVIYPVDRPLYSYAAGSSKVVPDVAAGEPETSPDGKTITIRLKRGIKFAPPVNREVTSADIKYAIERGFSASVPNSYASTYFSGIEGAPSSSPATPQPISGIQTPDDHTIVFKLKNKPAAVTVTGALVLPLTAPVPEKYAREFDNKKLSDYGFNQIASGPYMIQNDANGKVNGVGYIPSKSITLVRNPNWDSKTDFRPAYADKIVFSEGFQDPTVITKKILAGSGDANGDTPIPGTELKQILGNKTQNERLLFTPLTGTRYIPLNTSKPPFTNEHVRRAVAYVLDRNAMRKTRGGPIDGDIATHFIDPSFTGRGFEDAGGRDYNPFPSENFAGDVDKALAEMKLAAKDPGMADLIDADTGMYTGPQLTMVADNVAPGSNTAKVVAADLAKIGIDTRIVSVTHSAMYTSFCNVPKKEPEICPNVGWGADFFEPESLLNVTFNGKYIKSTNNSNWPLLNDPKINAAMDKAATIIDPKERYKAWGEIDKMIVETGAAIPWIWEQFPTLFANRVIPAIQTWNAAPDVAFMSVK
jgi:peptide/nickel transport system substrate-binding protein